MGVRSRQVLSFATEAGIAQADAAVKWVSAAILSMDVQIESRNRGPLVASCPGEWYLAKTARPVPG
jgi:hypothetical protein